MTSSRKQAKAIRLLVVAVLLVHASLGCRHNDGDRAEAGRNPAPVLLIGVDGFEWNVVLRMIHDGHLPQIRQLMQKGSYGFLQTLSPTTSPALWTTIATGKTPAKHGIRHFIHRAKNGEPPRLFTSHDRKTKAFWNILSDFNRSVYTVGWWITFPSEPVNGVMVAQVNTRGQIRGQIVWKGTLVRGLEGQVYPPEQQDELLGIAQDTDDRLPDLMKTRFGAWSQPSSQPLRDALGACQWAFRADTVYERIAFQLLSERGVPDMMAIYLGGPDVVGHRFWKYMEPGAFSPPPPEAEVREFGRIINDYYAHVDDFIGRIRGHYPAESTIFIISDHGMHSSSGPNSRISGAHGDAPPAFFVSAGPMIRHTLPERSPETLVRSDLQVLGSILDIMPTLLLIEHIPAGLDMDGRAIGSIFDDSMRPSPLPAITTHDTEQWMRSRPGLRPGEDVDPERLEQLRGLGYIN